MGIAAISARIDARRQAWLAASFALVRTVVTEGRRSAMWGQPTIRPILQWRWLARRAQII